MAALADRKVGTEQPNAAEEGGARLGGEVPDGDAIAGGGEVGLGELAPGAVVKAKDGDDGVAVDKAADGGEPGEVKPVAEVLEESLVGPEERTRRAKGGQNGAARDESAAWGTRADEARGGRHGCAGILLGEARPEMGQSGDDQDLHGRESESGMRWATWRMAAS